jgi:hypothetical protein
MPHSCLEEAEWILKIISLCKAKQVNSDEVCQYALPALKAAFVKIESNEVIACEIYEFVYSLAQLPSEHNPTLRLLSLDGRRCLCDCLLTAGGHMPGEQVRSM